MVQGCQQHECTVAQTGKCLLNNDPSQCPNRASDVDVDPAGVSTPGATVLEPPKSKPRFPASWTLSPEDANELMCKRYCRVVGILGAPDAGKTASLVSLYLLLGHGRLDGFEFCDSRTLVAFEKISQGARRWNEGAVPEQMTSHTELADERTAGFLHLRLRCVDSDERFEILLPDLPGEWTTSLVDKNLVERWDFLKSADAIWLMLDGQKLIETQTRIRATYRAKLMIQRVAALLKPAMPNVTLVITRLDLGRPAEQTLRELECEAAEHGLNVTIVHIASFTENPEIAAGSGISELLKDSMTDRGSSQAGLWVDDGDRTGHRAMLRFRE